MFQSWHNHFPNQTEFDLEVLLHCVKIFSQTKKKMQMQIFKGKKIHSLQARNPCDQSSQKSKQHSFHAWPSWGAVAQERCPKQGWESGSGGRDSCRTGRATPGSFPSSRPWRLTAAPRRPRRRRSRLGRRRSVFSVLINLCIFVQNSYSFMCFACRWWWMGRRLTGIVWGRKSRLRFTSICQLLMLTTFRKSSLWILCFSGRECDWRWHVWAQVGRGEKLQCDRIGTRLSGELEVEQDSGLPRARHPRRHLAGSSHIEYDDRVGQCDVESETLRCPLSDWNELTTVIQWHLNPRFDYIVSCDFVQ